MNIIPSTWCLVRVSPGKAEGKPCIDTRSIQLFTSQEGRSSTETNTVNIIFNGCMVDAYYIEQCNTLSIVLLYTSLFPYDALLEEERSKCVRNV